MRKGIRIFTGWLVVVAAPLWFFQGTESSGVGGVFTSTIGPMSGSRFGHTATLLTDGEVLLVGGNSGGYYTQMVERYHPGTDSFSWDSLMPTSRYLHTATLLADGRVLIAGGLTSGVTVTDTMLVYDPVTHTFTYVASMRIPRYGHTATLLEDGRVLLAGGFFNTTGITRMADIYNPADDSVSALPDMFELRANHTATLLTDGRVLIAGGLNSSVTSSSSTNSSAELYDPVGGTHTSTASGMLSRRHGHTATILDDGRVLIAGGWNGSSYSKSAELYDPGVSMFSLTDEMTDARYAHTATLLSDGQVLVAGGYRGGYALANAGVYDPATGLFTATDSMPGGGRYYHTATRLTDGQVLVAGGTPDLTSSLGSAALFRIPPPPTADAGPDQYLTANNLGEVQITLTGTATGGLPFDSTWTIDGVVVGTSLTVETTVGLGTHVAMLSVTDAAGRTATNTAVIAVSLPVIPGPPGPPGTVPSGALILVLQGDPAPADSTYIGSYRQTLSATPGSQGQSPVIIVDMYRKN